LTKKKRCTIVAHEQPHPFLHHFIYCARQHMFSKPSSRWTGRDELATIKIDKQGCYLLSLEHPEEVICISHRLHIRVWLKNAVADKREKRGL